jgi:hypothetical protein
MLNERALPGRSPEPDGGCCEAVAALNRAIFSAGRFRDFSLPTVFLDVVFGFCRLSSSKEREKAAFQVNEQEKYGTAGLLQLNIEKGNKT